MPSGDPQTQQPSQQEQPQQDSTATAQRRLRDRLLVTLAAIAGYTDAISYVALGHVFAANMTGSTVLLALGLAQRDFSASARAGVALAGFLVGVAIGAAMLRRRAQGEIWPHATTLTLGVETGVMALFATLGLVLGTHDQHGVVYLLIALASCAMGLQSAAARSLGVPDISTTYLTGTWTSLMSNLSRRLRAEVVAEVEAEVEHERLHPPALPPIYPQERAATLLLAYIIAALLCGLLISVGSDIDVRLALIPLTPALAIVVAVAARGFGVRRER